MKVLSNKQMHLTVLVFLFLLSCSNTSNVQALGFLGLTGCVTALGAAVVVVWVQNGYAPPYMPSPNSLTGQTILITGATTGLGLESAKRLAAGGANVILTARSDAKGQAAVEQVKQFLLKETKSSYDDQPTISYKVLDLDSLDQVRNAVNSWNDIEKIDVLMNNAGVMALPERQLTVDGFEKQIQSNHLGHFLLTALLFPKLSPTARIVNVSSSAHKMAFNGIHFDNLWKADQNYRPFPVYGQTKLANILFSQELQKRLDAAGLSSMTAVAVHPGAVETELGRNMIPQDSVFRPVFDLLFQIPIAVGIIKTVDMGASTQVWVSCPEATKSEDIKGKYFADCKEAPVEAKINDEMAARLWKESEQMAGVTFNIIQQPVVA